MMRLEEPSQISVLPLGRRWALLMKGLKKKSSPNMPFGMPFMPAEYSHTGVLVTGLYSTTRLQLWFIVG